MDHALTSAAAPDEVSQAELEDLQVRLRAFRPVPGVGAGWELGADADALVDLIRYWADGYDWRAAEGRIRSLPWARSQGGLRVVHQRAAEHDAQVVVLLHGWPDSVLRFDRVLPLLRDVHVVVPALPGFPFSASPGTSAAAMADPIAAALAELGCTRCVVSGGDIGADVAEALARRDPDRVTAMHLTDLPWGPVLTLPQADLTPGERAFTAELQEWQQAEGAYRAEHATKPDTLSVALGDSPAGLLAWILEKLRGWSDCGGDVLSVFSRDELLTWVSAYWFSGAIGTSFAPYALRQQPVNGRPRAPLVATLFPHDLLHPPREYAERLFDVREWRTPAAGGHFDAWEQPKTYVAGIRAALAL